MAAPKPAFRSEDITAVVAEFYAQIRDHPELGPVFAAHVRDWPSHEARIALFWRNALMKERLYSGNPMQKHLLAGNVRPHHFHLWLNLFDVVLKNTLSEAKAQHWSILAHRIGRSLKMGLEYASQAAAKSPPLLKA